MVILYVRFVILDKWLYFFECFFLFFVFLEKYWLFIILFVLILFMILFNLGVLYLLELLIFRGIGWWVIYGFLDFMFLVIYC